MDVLDILQRIGYTDLRDHGKEWRAKPLYRASGNNTSLAVNKNTGDWYDFSSRQGGGLASLVKLSLGMATIADAEHYMGDTALIGAAPKRNRYELTEIKKFDKTLLFKLQQDHEYWLKRNISLETIKIFQGGVSFNGKMAYRYVFPIFDDKDELIGFSGRSLTNNPDYPKWKHIGAKSNWCYPLKWNTEIIQRTKEVILLESIGDMLALWDNGIKNTIVTFGVDISSKIIQFLIKMDVERIILGFNNDSENEFVGNIACEDGKEQLLSFFDERQIEIGIPESKDFGIMSSEQIALWKQKHNLKN